MIRPRTLWRLVLVPCLWLPGPVTFAAPSGGDLLRACELALAGGFSGIEGRMCTWYVMPCDCDPATNPEIPRVCLPAAVTTELLARKVVTGLAAQPELQLQDADMAAALILSRIYPCTDEAR